MAEREGGGRHVADCSAGQLRTRTARRVASGWCGGGGNCPCVTDEGGRVRANPCGFIRLSPPCDAPSSAAMRRRRG